MSTPEKRPVQNVLGRNVRVCNVCPAFHTNIVTFLQFELMYQNKFYE